MPIEFACSSCHLKYSVKDELAGRTAKCGKCGHRMRIPQATVATPSASAKVAAASKPAASASRPAAKPAPKPVAASVDDDTSWLNDELETAQPVIATPSRSSGKSCPSCGKPLDRNAVLCVSCGYDLRMGEKRETQHLADSPADAKKAAKRSKAAAAGSLLRGTLFSFIAALIGALVWAVIAYLTMHEFAYVAWGLGALVGFGMALGHDDGDGTFAGIIAAFMSLFGIVAAKVMIIVLFVGAAVGSLVDELNVEAPNFDPVEMKREMVAAFVAENNMRAEGVDVDEANEDQWEAAMTQAHAEIKDLDEKGLDEKFAEMARKGQTDGMMSLDGEVEDDPPEDAEVAEAAEIPDADAEIGVGVEDPGLVKLFFSEMFSPFDALFILLAFFTAYKVGSGEMTD